MAQRSDLEVWGLARFNDPQARADLESGGVTCFAMDMATDRPGGLPDDFDYVLNFGVVKSRNYNWATTSTPTPAGWGSSPATVVRPGPCCTVRPPTSTGQTVPIPWREDDPLSDTPRSSDVLATYTICRIAAEAMARYCARQFDLPTTIARLNVPYGRNGGWLGHHLDMVLAGEPIPIFPGGPNTFNPIHESDIVAMIPGLLAAADTPAVTVNWGGSVEVSVEEWCSYLGHLVKRPARFLTTDTVVGATPIDVTRMHEIVGPTAMPWRTGVRDMVAHRQPDRKLADDLAEWTDQG